MAYRGMSYQLAPLRREENDPDYVNPEMRVSASDVIRHTCLADRDLRQLKCVLKKNIRYR